MKLWRIVMIMERAAAHLDGYEVDGQVAAD